MASQTRCENEEKMYVVFGSNDDCNVVVAIWPTFALTNPK